MQATFTVNKSDNDAAPPIRPYSEQEQPVASRYRDDGHLPDNELFIRRTFDENPQAGCKLLFQLYYKPMCTHAVRFVYSKEIAEDLVSDVFYTFWNTQAFKSVNRSFRAYLFRSVRNSAYNYLANEFRKSAPLDSAGHQVVAQSDGPESITCYNELYGKIDELVASLPPQCRNAFILHRFEGKRAKEIASQMDVSVRTIEVHIAKALATLRDGLKNQWLIVPLTLWLQNWAETLL
ncbi:RNA polymerase sigma-70 factor [Spirosoma sp. BT702]|uniref:RNA polymerase sigma-70 factor n=1 Tax=Spirosoma profusum TaxID=2771354 RepID=A0A927AMD8_9BACT|nr:RNA polymerase sigma-70 factor [Spirosoma profusum]MBD2699584.1 RNA polymerase sigma-70 factor [Spirosoma profusum]